MNLGTLAESTVTALLSTNTGVPALVIDLLPLLALFIGIRLVPKLVRKFAR